MDAEYCWVLDIDKSEDELLAAMRKTTRYEIRHAQKLGIGNTFNDQRISNIGEFLFALYDETSKRHGFVRHQGIEEEFEVFAAEKKSSIVFRSMITKTIAGAIILFYGNQAIYHHGASLTGKIPASYLIQWEAIREAKKRGFKLYNFWGIAPDDNPNHPWRGITLFKKGFGGRESIIFMLRTMPYQPCILFRRQLKASRKKCADIKSLCFEHKILYLYRIYYDEGLTTTSYII